MILLSHGPEPCASEDLKTAKDIKQEEIEKDADIQEKSKEEISENEQCQTQENIVKANTTILNFPHVLSPSIKIFSQRFQ